MRNIRNRTILLLVVSMITIILTSCGSPATENAINPLNEALTARIEKNTKIIDSLQSYGLLDETSANAYKADIRKRIEDLKTTVTDQMTHKQTSVSSEFSNFAASIVGYSYVYTQESHTWTDDKGNERTCTDWVRGDNSIYLSNWLGGILDSVNIATPVKDGIDAKPIELIGDSLTQELVKQLQFEVYTIKDTTSIEMLYRDAKDINFETDQDKVNSFISTYFTDSGKKTDLVDASTLVTSLGPREEIDKLQTTKLGDNYVPNINRSCPRGIAAENLGNPNTSLKCSDELGEDMLIQYDGNDMLKIRVKEFNGKNIQKLLDQFGEHGEYIMTKYNGATVALLMEYPVGYVSGFTTYKTGDNLNYSADIKLSDLRVNFRTGEIKKKQGGITGFIKRNDGTYFGNISTTDTINTSTVDKLITVSSDEMDTSSFTIYGTTGNSVENSDNENAFNMVLGVTKADTMKTVTTDDIVDIPRVVLLDYMEATYNPGIISGESLVAYGRRIRLDKDKLEGTIPTSNSGSRRTIGYYLNFDIKKPDDESTIRELYLDDLCDINYLDGNNNTPQIVRLQAFSNEKTIEKPNESSENNESTSLPSDVDGLKESVIEGSIETTMAFPGPLVDTYDNLTVWSSGSDKPLLYTMAVKTPTSTSGLLTWMSDEGGFNKWVKWLVDHKYTYGNLLNSDNVIDFFKNNYSFNVSQNGLIAIDLETVGKINEELIHDEAVGRVRFIRTMFKIVGYGLTLYSMLLLACWAFDVNIDLGLGLLEKVSFNRLVAVSSREEIPQDTDENKKYVQFSDIIIQSIIISTVGIFLVLIDTIAVIRTLTGAVSGIAKSISGLFGG